MATLTGSAGNDTYLGAVGVDDIALIDSGLASASFSFDGYRWTVTSTVGVDTLSSVESVVLKDATLELVAGMGETGVQTGIYRYPSVTQNPPRVASLSDGGQVVTWVIYDGRTWDVYAQTFDAAGNELGPESIILKAVASLSAPTPTGLSDGGYVVAWESMGLNEGSFSDIYAQRFDASGIPVGALARVNTTATGNQTAADVAALADGGHVVTWLSPTVGNWGPDYRLFAQRFDANGASVGGELALANLHNNSPEIAAEVIALSGGGFSVVWSSYDELEPEPGIYLRTVSSDGVPAGAVKMVAQGAFNSPSIAALKDGGQIVCWAGRTDDGLDSEIYLQRFDSAGGKAGEVELVNASTAENQLSPVVVGLSDGGYVVVWETFVRRTGVNDYDLMAQRYDADGFQVGGEILVNTTLAGNQTLASVAAQPDGGFVVVWASVNGSNTDILSQRFDADGNKAMAEISGDGGNNVITTTGQTTQVRLLGNGGNDSLTGGALGDVLNGGSGADTLVGGLGNDVYTWRTEDKIVELANAGIDTVNVNQTYTLTSPHLENATLTGTAKADLIGNSANNVLRGNSADNVLDGGAGADTLGGGAGNDTYLVDHLGDRAKEGAAVGAGTDSVISSVGFTLETNVEHLELRGAAAIDGTGNASGNRLLGNDQANRLDGAGGSDTMVGGLGNDTYVVGAGDGDSFLEYDGEGKDTLEINSHWTLNASLDSIENLTLWGSGNFKAIGDGGANVLKGNAGNNLLDGKGGNDTLDGGGGADTYIVASSGDRASEQGSSAGDLVKASLSWTLGAQLENLTLTGSSGLSGKGNGLDNLITGNSGANRLEGLAGADTLLGGAGNDTLVGTDGSDALKGGTGNDTYQVNSGSDETVELSGEGTDTVVATVSGAYTLNAQVENLQLVGGDIDGLGNTLANRITGTDGNNLLDGGGGNDVLTGGGGNDSYIVDSVGDQLVELDGAGTDEVFSTVTLTLGDFVERLTLTGGLAVNGSGNLLANRLTGNSAANQLSGSDGNDQLNGEGGNDKLTGGKGNDTVRGGSGDDIFRFSSALNASSNVDAVSDFVVVDDSFQLENSVFTAFISTGTIASGHLRAGNGFKTAADPNDFVIYDRSTGSLYYDADGSGSASAAIKFAVLASGLSLTAADFLIT